MQKKVKYNILYLTGHVFLHRFIVLRGSSGFYTYMSDVVLFIASCEYLLIHFVLVRFALLSQD
jgi:hypothetical protein